MQIITGIHMNARVKVSNLVSNYLIHVKKQRVKLLYIVIFQNYNIYYSVIVVHVSIILE